MVPADIPQEEMESRSAAALAAARADTVQMPRALRPRPSARYILAMSGAVACWLLPLVALAVAGNRKDHELLAVRGERDALRAELRTLSHAWPDVPVLLLGAATDGARFTVDPAAPWLVVRVDHVPAGLAHEATLFDGVGREVWSGRLRAGDGALSLALPGARLPAGRYRFEARRAGAAPTTFHFELVRP